MFIKIYDNKKRREFVSYSTYRIDEDVIRNHLWLKYHCFGKTKCSLLLAAVTNIELLDDYFFNKEERNTYHTVHEIYIDSDKRV